MSGILDNKSRMIDAILTSEGRRQMAEGDFKVSYVTFADADVAYEYDPVTGHVDPTNRIYLEACNLPQDQITFEANDAGKIKPFRAHDITVTAPDTFPGSTSKATLEEGRLVAYEMYHGRRIQVSSILEFPTDAAKGFTYSDTSMLTASILVDPNSKAGTISGSLSAPYFATIGTKGGLSARGFATAISGAINLLANNGGPTVFPTAAENIVYLDIGQMFSNTVLFTTGVLSSPIIIDEAQIGSKVISQEIQSAAFATQIQGILMSSLDNFLQLQTIATVNQLFDDKDFVLSKNEISFNLSDVQNVVCLSSMNKPPSVNEINSLFNDDKLSHVDNFLYLPPIVKTSDTVAPDKTDINNLKSLQRFLGNYPSWGDNENKLTYSTLKNQMLEFGISNHDIYFNKHSINNNIIGQFFEISKDSSVSKLDVIDFGEIYNPVNKTQEKVFFAGKVFLDNRGTACFVNMFTLIFSDEKGGL